MSKEYIIALDQGTTSSRAIIFDKYAEVVASCQIHLKQIYPQRGWVEQDPECIYNSVVDALKQVLEKGNIECSQVMALGITNQRETTIIWDKDSGKPIYNAIVWQCHRTKEFCEQLKQQNLEDKIYSITGLPIDPYFSATKIKWLLDNVKGARQKAEQGKLMFGTVDTYLMWKLSGGKIFATDYSNASRTMLFNIHTLEWEKQLLDLFDIPQSILPKVCPSSYDYGYVDSSILGESLAILSAAGDQQASLFGNLCTHKGMVKNTYGTGCFTLMNTGDKAVSSSSGLITTLAASLDGQKPQYALEGSVFVGGAVLSWLRDEMKMISCPHQADEIAAVTQDSNGVYIVPAFVGLGAPYWDASASGTICGLTRGANREHLIRAALESIAYQVYDVVQAMQKDLGEKITCLKVDGGASVSDPLMQFQADILCTKTLRPKMAEVTALGVCYLAGIQAGLWKNVDDIKCNCLGDKVFEPNMSQKQREKNIQGWKSAIQKSLI